MKLNQIMGAELRLQELIANATDDRKRDKLLRAHSLLEKKALKIMYKEEREESAVQACAEKPKERKMFDYFNDKFRSHLPGCSTMEAAFKRASDEVWKECGFLPYSSFRSFNNVRKRNSKRNNVAL